jgi:hypothetical protein
VKIGDHDLDLSEIDETDEETSDEAYCLVWCRKHEKYEWHWLPLDDLDL